jgi:hypothetical protein
MCAVGLTGSCIGSSTFAHLKGSEGCATRLKTQKKLKKKESRYFIILKCLKNDDF